MSFALAENVMFAKVASPASGHVGTCPPPLALERIFPLGYLSGLVWYYAKLLT